MEINDKSNCKILIVDDEQKNIQILGSILRQENYIIGVATNGKQAINALLDAGNYDMVLLDVNMPVMDGFTTCKIIREQESLKDLPVIFLTAFVDSESIVNGFEIGGQDYITKPFNSKELLARINTHLELKKSKDQLKQVNKWLEMKVKERTIELASANSKLLQLDNAKSEFLNIISHEIRTPLNGVIGAISILNDSQLPEEVIEMFEILDISAKRLEEFSYKALDISYFNTMGTDALKLSRNNINELINQIIPQFTDITTQKNISIVLDAAKNNPTALSDEQYVKKCFSYIINNALRFGNKNSQVVIKTMVKEESILVSVEDEGSQFPEDFNIAYIQPFSNKSHIDLNPGLSLFLCKQIIEAHKGSLEIINTTKGAIVNIMIPAIPS